jgi:hypothetical protein
LVEVISSNDKGGVAVLSLASPTSGEPIYQSSLTLKLLLGVSLKSKYGAELQR